jgi:DNA-directed RNA polymerase-4/5 subunit 7
VRQQTGDVVFLVYFSAITFKLYKGEISEEVVHKVLKHGVLLKCGPGYCYEGGESPLFRDNLLKIEKDVVVRFIVIGTIWLEAEREFQALVSLEGNYLGPISQC